MTPGELLTCPTCSTPDLDRVLCHPPQDLATAGSFAIESAGETLDIIRKLETS